MKFFITPEEVTHFSEVVKQHYNNVKSLSEKLELKLHCETLNVGNEYFIVPSPIEQDTKVIQAICNGYSIRTDFNEYDEETGFVDTACNPTFIDIEGNSYCWPIDVIFVEETQKEAEQLMEEMKSIQD